MSLLLQPFKPGHSNSYVRSQYYDFQNPRQYLIAQYLYNIARTVIFYKWEFPFNTTEIPLYQPYVDLGFRICTSVQ